MLEQFKRLPQHPTDVWEGGLFSMPAWVERSDGKPCRPRMALWVSTAKQLVSEVRHIEEGCAPHQSALDSLVQFGLGEDIQSRPSLIEVNDEELARYLTEQLTDGGVRVEAVPELAEMQRVLDGIGEHLAGRPEPPSMLDGKGMAIERLRSFVEAAAMYYAARPWLQLIDEDLIEVESPTPHTSFA